MINELAQAVLYVNYTRQLWEELTERFGQSNGPLLYQLEKELSELYQENDSVVVYYTKMKNFGMSWMIFLEYLFASVTLIANLLKEP